MHVGGVRTALFAWALAKQHKGQFILRIEDTDKSREVAGSVQHIIDSLQWLGIDWQEGPDVGGEFGPYTQSERLDLYRQWAQKLIDTGQAYVDPYSPEEVGEFRRQATAEKRPFLFRQHRPEDLQVPDSWYQNHALRFKTPQLKRYEWFDEVRGGLSAGEDALDDYVIIKKDGYPTYNFAHIVDDHLMEITHVIRGEEFIASMPKFLSMYEALQLDTPKFVTVPPILNQRGGKKLSKREGARDVLEYRDDGYPPEVIVNFLTSLGWNDGTDQEVYSPEEFVTSFSVNRIQKSGAKFDETKLQWLQWQHVVRLISEKSYSKVLELANVKTSIPIPAITLAATKANSLESLRQQLCIFGDHQPFALTADNLKLVDKKLTSDMAQYYLQQALQTLETNDFSVTSLESSLRGAMEQLDAKPRQFLNLIRWVTSGQKVSPSLFEMLAVLGKDKTLSRLRTALDN